MEKRFSKIKEETKPQETRLKLYETKRTKIRTKKYDDIFVELFAGKNKF